MENALCKRQDGEGHPQQVQCLHRSHNHGHDNGDHHHDEGLVKCIGKRRDWRGGWSKPLGSNTFPHAETTETSINIIIVITIDVIISNNKLLSFLIFGYLVSWPLSCLEWLRAESGEPTKSQFSHVLGSISKSLWSPTPTLWNLPLSRFLQKNALLSVCCLETWITFKRTVGKMPFCVL